MASIVEYPPSARALLHHLIRTRGVVPWIGAGISMHTLPGWVPAIKAVWERISPSEPFDDMLYRTKCAIRTADGGVPFIVDILQLTDIVSRACVQRQTRMEDAIEALFLEKINSVGVGVNIASCSASSSSASSVSSASSSVSSASSASSWQKHRALMAHLTAHRECLKGKFPLIITTNWDDFFERAADDAGRRGHGNKPTTDNAGRAVRVRYRADVSQLFGELKRADEYDAAPLLFKLHGDFSAKGRGEFVLGHASYRSMKKANKSTRDLLAHVANNKSLFFFGTSLSDDDILSILDDAQESFGASACVHFWLTADDVSMERMVFLCRHYNVQTIRLSGDHKWARLGKEFSLACSSGKTLDRRIALRKMSFEVGKKSCPVELTLCAKHLPSAVLMDEADSSFKSVALSVPLTPLTGDFQSVRSRAGRQMAAFASFSPACAEAIHKQTKGLSKDNENWRALRLEKIGKEDTACRGSFFIVMADAVTANNLEAMESKHNQSVQKRVADLNGAIREATVHFLIAACAHECEAHLARERDDLAGGGGLLGFGKRVLGFAAADNQSAGTAGAGTAAGPASGGWDDSIRPLPTVLKNASGGLSHYGFGNATIRLVLPLLGTGLKQLHERNALRTMLSATMSTIPALDALCVRAFIDAGSKLRPKISISICCPVDGPNSSIMNEIASGDFPVASILALAPLVSARAVLFDESGSVSRTQQILIDMKEWQWRTLRAALQMEPEGFTRVVGWPKRLWAPDEKVHLCRSIVEGSTVQIEDAGVVGCKGSGSGGSGGAGGEKGTRPSSTSTLQEWHQGLAPCFIVNASKRISVWAKLNKETNTEEVIVCLTQGEFGDGFAFKKMRHISDIWNMMPVPGLSDCYTFELVTTGKVRADDDGSQRYFLVADQVLDRTRLVLSSSTVDQKSPRAQFFVSSVASQGVGGSGGASEAVVVKIVAVATREILVVSTGMKSVCFEESIGTHESTGAKFELQVAP